MNLYALSIFFDVGLLKSGRDLSDENLEVLGWINVDIKVAYPFKYVQIFSPC